MPTIKVFNNINPSLDKQIEYDFGDEKLAEILHIYDKSITAETKSRYRVAVGDELINDWSLPIDTCLAYGDSILIAEKFEISIKINIVRERTIKLAPHDSRTDFDSLKKSLEIDDASFPSFISSNGIQQKPAVFSYFIDKESYKSPTIQLEIDKRTTIESLKRKIKDLANIPIENQAIVFKRTHLADDSSTLSDYGIFNHDHLELFDKKATKTIFEEKIFHVDVVDLSGKKIALKLRLYNTIEDVKNEIAKQGETPTSEQLLYEGRDALSDNGYKLFTSQDRVGFKFIRLIRRAQLAKDPALAIPLFVKTLTGQTLTINLGLFESIRQFKSLIEAETNIPVDQQRLIYAGRQFEDDMVLNNYPICRESTVHLVLRLRGGFSFANVTDDGELMEWSKDAPKWREAARGLCLEGKCKNNKCEVFGHMVIINMGVPISHKVGMPGQKRTDCPMCQTHVNTETCAFNNCWFRYVGVMTTDSGPARHKSEWKQINDSYYRFDEENKSDWIRLGRIVELLIFFSKIVD
jgi:hypothetical protein